MLEDASGIAIPLLTSCRQIGNLIFHYDQLTTENLKAQKGGKG